VRWDTPIADLARLKILQSSRTWAVQVIRFGALVGTRLGMADLIRTKREEDRGVASCTLWAAAGSRVAVVRGREVTGILVWQCIADMPFIKPPTVAARYNDYESNLQNKPVLDTLRSVFDGLVSLFAAVALLRFRLQILISLFI